MFRFLLPDLGEGIHEGEILSWHVAEGGTVVEDAPLVDIETDKAAVTIPSPRGGQVARHGGRVGDLIRVGDLLAEIDDGTGNGAGTPGPEPQPQPEPAQPPAEPAANRPPGRPVPAAPATRRLARELRVELADVRATGPAGRVTDEDVRRHAEGKTPDAANAQASSRDAHEERPDDETSTTAPSPQRTALPFPDMEPMPTFEEFGPVHREPLRSVRRRTARHMVTSSLVIPHVAHMDEADITDLEQVRRTQKEQHRDQPGGNLTLLAFVMKAVVAGLREHPRFNASIDMQREEIIFKDHCHLGFAADTPRGLLVPVIRDADRRSILGLAAAVQELAERARSGEITADQMRGGTFTLTNIGAMGGTGLIPLINHPEVAILGMGRAAPKPVVRDGEVVVRTVLPLVLAFDHRIADGSDAVRFVNDLVRRLENPNTLLVEA